MDYLEEPGARQRALSIASILTNTMEGKGGGGLGSRTAAAFSSQVKTVLFVKCAICTTYSTDEITDLSGPSATGM